MGAECTCASEGSQIAYDILAYLAEHPDAQDTLEGIVQWWLLEQKIKNQVEKVKDALAHLTAKHLVLERTSKDARTHYRMNRRKVKEIRRLLQQRPK